MKKILNKLLFLLIIIIVIPKSNYVYAETITFGQMQDDLYKAQQELNKHNQSIDNQKDQIIKDNATIKALTKEIEEMGKESEQLRQEIADSNVKIDDLQEQTKNLVSYYQMSQGKNIYLDYVFGGETITDLIYRLAIVEQITEYNEKIIEDLEELITKNENRKIELANKQEEHEKKMVQLNNEIQKLTNSISKLGDLSPSLEQEVKDKKSIVDYYKQQGCKNRSDIIGVDCAVTSTNAFFTRPIKTGYVTSFTGYRWGSLHRGIDLGSSTGRNTPLYSIGNGIIKSIWEDGNGAKCVTIQYRDTSGKYYTAIYAHLSKYGNIYKNMKVDSNTVIGYMGDTGYAFGVHLHLEVWPCRIYEDSSCQTWNLYTQFAEKKFKEGFKGAESVISFPTKTYQTWYTK